ncbi:MAG TPA: DUF4232 domain-containing protein [Nocardioidaceae bacterium]|nr:DUF4232 domain-containing protein [Nocardioidaceae bacterium]
MSVLTRLLGALTAVAASGALAASTAAGVPAATASSSARTVPWCTTGDVSVRLGHGDGAAGSVYFPLVLRNHTGHACRTRGYPGVSYVGGGNGTQIGAPADRVRPALPAVPPPVVRLDPGERAVAVLREVDALNYPRHRCRPERTDGLRVYPPGEYAAAFVPQHTVGCRNHRVHLLTVAPFHHAH